MSGNRRSADRSGRRSGDSRGSRVRPSSRGPSPKKGNNRLSANKMTPPALPGEERDAFGGFVPSIVAATSKTAARNGEQVAARQEKKLLLDEKKKKLAYKKAGGKKKEGGVSDSYAKFMAGFSGFSKTQIYGGIAGLLTVAVVTVVVVVAVVGGVPCRTDSDCAEVDGAPWCDLEQEVCVGCRSVNDCPDDGLFCNGAPTCNDFWRVCEEPETEPCAAPKGWFGTDLFADDPGPLSVCSESRLRCEVPSDELIVAALVPPTGTADALRAQDNFGTADDPTAYLQFLTPHDGEIAFQAFEGQAEITTGFKFDVTLTMSAIHPEMTARFSIFNTRTLEYELLLDTSSYRDTITPWMDLTASFGTSSAVDYFDETSSQVRVKFECTHAVVADGGTCKLDYALLTLAFCDGADSDCVCGDCSDAGTCDPLVGSTCRCWPDKTGKNCDEDAEPLPKLVDPEEAYALDPPFPGEPLRATIETYDGISDYKWADILADTESGDAFSPKVRVSFRVQDSAGVDEFGHENPVTGEPLPLGPNAMLKRRGGVSRESFWPSFKIKLDDVENTGLWRGQDNINLIKSPYDSSRIRNKLVYELIRTMEDLVSFRSYWIDVSVRLPNGTLADYGLFTVVENGNARYLDNHGLEPGLTGVPSTAEQYQKTEFYKISRFRWLTYHGEIMDHRRGEYSEIEFESRLEIKVSESHFKMLRALRDVNDWSIPMRSIIDGLFNEDNLVSWMALNILSWDVDHNVQNFYLYSPSTSDRGFYILPWDYDDAFIPGFSEFHFPWQVGHHNYMTNVLWYRYFTEIPDALDKIDAKINAAMEGSWEFISLAELFADIINSVQFYAPLDQNDIYVDEAAWTGDTLNGMLYNPPFAVSNWTNVLDLPTPPASLFVEHYDPTTQVTWAPSVSLNGLPLTYDLRVCTSSDCSSVVYSALGLSDSPHKASSSGPYPLMVHELPPDELTPGVKYYFELTVEDSLGARNTYASTIDDRYECAPFPEPFTVDLAGKKCWVCCDNDF